VILIDEWVAYARQLRGSDDDGFKESTQRTVSENATNLGATSSEFE